MARSIGAQLGLLVFGVAILAGLRAGNSATTVLVRALLAMVAAYGIGQLVGWFGRLVLRDHLQPRKLALDRSHRDAVRAMNPSPAPPERPAPPQGG
jgi:hypothetical protein